MDTANLCALSKPHQPIRLKIKNKNEAEQVRGLL